MSSPLPVQQPPPTSFGRRRKRARSSLLARGEPMVWLTGGGLALALAMIVGLLLLILVEGLVTFWPTPLIRIGTADGAVYLGEVTREERFRPAEETLAALPEAQRQALISELEEHGSAYRRLLRTGNFDVSGTHFTWVEDFHVADEQRPPWAVVIERLEWGRFYGTPSLFQQHVPRPVSAREAALAALLAAVRDGGDVLDTPAEGGDGAVSGADAGQAAPPPPATRVETLSARIAPILDAERRRSAAAFVAEHQATAERIDLLDAEGSVLPADADAAAVAAVRLVWEGEEDAWARFVAEHDEARALYQRREDIKKHEIGAMNARLEDARLAVRRAEIDHDIKLLARLRDEVEAQRALEGVRGRIAGLDLLREGAALLGDAAAAEAAEELTAARRRELQPALLEAQAALADFEAQRAELPSGAAAVLADAVRLHVDALAVNAELEARIEEIKQENERRSLRLVTAGGIEKDLLVRDIVRAYPANQLGLGDKVSIYLSRWGEFLADDPREANSEGGVWPAIFGTVIMTLIMTIVVVPFGVLAALYLREYAQAGLLVSTIRIAINNLAGVPSIVFGVFGLGFFCYVIGGWIDSGPQDPLSQGNWSLAMTLFVVLLLAAVAISVLRIRRNALPGDGKGAARFLLPALWLASVAMLVVVLGWTPYFDGFYREKLPNPTFNKGGIMWASLTLALLTLPVVIVATEEALAAVPRSMREGSYACGASKWQTIKRIVLPRAMPGIMTGTILAMARGAGEVAPLMLVGAVKLAPELPIELSQWGGSIGPIPTGPLHAERSFMHLGFHIFDLGFQSQNSEAAKPMVFTTTLLLIGIIVALNLVAITLRGRLRRRFSGDQF